MAAFGFIVTHLCLLILYCIILTKKSIKVIMFQTFVSYCSVLYLYLNKSSWRSSCSLLAQLVYANMEADSVCVSQQVLLETVYSDTRWKVQTEAATPSWGPMANAQGKHSSLLLWQLIHVGEQHSIVAGNMICACLDLIRTETVTG